MKTKTFISFKAYLLIFQNCYDDMLIRINSLADDSIHIEGSIRIRIRTNLSFGILLTCSQVLKII